MIFIKTLYIIGNGFDIAHGLNTKYWELREYIAERDHYFLSSFEELYNIHPLDDSEPWYTKEHQERWNKSVDHSLWSAFEKSMGVPDTEMMIGFSAAATEGMPRYGVKDHMDLYWQERFEFIKKLQKYVKEWIESIDTSAIQPKVSNLLHSDDLFLNFNYTDVLEKIYEIKNVYHIHGGVEWVCDYSPILGHCNKVDIIKHREWAKEAAEEFEEAKESILNAVANYLEIIYKDTDEQILINKDFFEELKEIEHIVIIGWSAGEVDVPYLREIISKIDSRTKWTVYYFDETAYETLKKVFDEEGITDINIIEYRNSEEFWEK